MLYPASHENRDVFSGKPRRIAVALVIGLIISLLWLIIRHSLATAVSVSSPETALLLNPQSPVATLVMAQKLISAEIESRRLSTAGQTKPDQTGAERADILPGRSDTGVARSETATKLRQLVGREPLNASAQGLLARIAELDGKTTTSNQLFYMATRLSLRELYADYRVAMRHFRMKNYDAALYYSDAMLRADPGSFRIIAPLLTAMLSSDAARPFLARKLAERPPWRKTFLTMSYTAQNLANIDAPADLLRALRETAAPPDLSELSGYLGFLFEKKLFTRAYGVWLEFLPLEKMEYTGSVFNGSFESEPSGLSFDWIIGRGTEADVNIFTHPDEDDQQALLVSFGVGRIVFPLVQEIIMLPPGQHQLSVLIKGDVSGRRGLQWKVICENGVAADNSPMILGRFRNWTRHESDIVIPDAGCRFQYLRLIHAARTPSEQYARGRIWFDQLMIRRANKNSGEE